MLIESSVPLRNRKNKRIRKQDEKEEEINKEVLVENRKEWRRKRRK